MKPFLVLVAALVALALGAFALLRVIQRPAPDVGVTVARRELLYEVGPGARVGFALPAERSDLRISSHLVLDARAGYDPARQYLYGLRVRVESPEGKELFRRELFFRARQSKAQRVGDRWRYENAFVPGGDVQLADRESMELWLPSEPPPPRSVLWIEALGQERRVWLNVYRREPEARGRSPRELALAAGEARANRVTYTPWGELMAEGLAARWPAWEKLAPEGESGRDYEPRAMYFSGFVLRARQEAPIHLEPGRRATLTVGGPVALAVRLSRMGGAAGSRRLRVEGLAVDGRRHEWMLALEAGQDEGMSDLPVPEGQHSLRLSTDEGPLSVEVFHLAREPEGSPGARTWPVPADEVRFDTYVASADCPPVEYDLGEPLEGEAALLRVDARTVGRVPEGGTRVELRWVDPEGREVPGGTVAVAPVPSPFERAHFPPGSPLLLGADGGVTDPAEAALAVSEPQSVHAVLPPRTRRVRLSASSPVLLSVFSLWAAPGPSTMVPPYESPDGGTLAWRYAPRERQLWYPLRAERHEEQEASGCVADVVAQVRLEAREDPDAGVSTGLEPLGGVAAQDVLERVDPVDRAEVVARWDGLSFTRLRPDEPVRLMFSRALAARPQLAYVLPAGDARQLGETVEVRVDGKPLHSFVLRT
ncbi:MAG TPA: hypothetical protein VK420_07870, partial [Longimicrobium sp.]|nr:hypothetical protein [Longimicrobium sp.]